jgi:peptidoglycan/LPS O-acetylase OafA/YrhL
MVQSRHSGGNAHLPALDGIRGIAILLVLLHHLAFYGGIRPTITVDTVFYAVAQAGWCGVDLFFVLSGFLITGILYDAKPAEHYFSNFYMRRVLRIFPLYYGTLIVFFWVLPNFVLLNEKFQALIQGQGWYWSYLVNWQIGFKGWPPYYAISHFWSLAIEEQFYLVWPLIVFFFSRRQLLMICVAVIAGSFVVRVGLRLADYPIAAYVLTPARMDTLAIGALLALIARGPDGLSKLSRWAGPVALVTGGAITAYFVAKRSLDADTAFMQTAGYPLLAAFFGAILVVGVTAQRQTATATFFAHPALVFFGRYSYALYVFHHPIIFYVRQHGFRVSNLPAIFGSQLPGQLLYSVVVGGVTVILALLSWYLYESRFLKLKRFFPYQRATPRIVVEKYEEVSHVPAP